MDKRSHIQQYLKTNSKKSGTPPDLCYVNNFDDRYKPKVLKLPAGRGRDLEEQMDKLIEELPPTLNSTFENRKNTKTGGRPCRKKFNRNKIKHLKTYKIKPAIRAWL